MLAQKMLHLWRRDARPNDQETGFGFTRESLISWHFLTTPFS